MRAGRRTAPSVSSAVPSVSAAECAVSGLVQYWNRFILQHERCGDGQGAAQEAQPAHQGEAHGGLHVPVAPPHDHHHVVLSVGRGKKKRTCSSSVVVRSSLTAKTVIVLFAANHPLKTVIVLLDALQIHGVPFRVSSTPVKRYDLIGSPASVTLRNESLCIDQMASITRPRRKTL